MIKNGVIEGVSILEDGRVKLEINEHNIKRDGLDYGITYYFSTPSMSSSDIAELLGGTVITESECNFDPFSVSYHTKMHIKTKSGKTLSFSKEQIKFEGDCYNLYKGYHFFP